MKIKNCFSSVNGLFSGEDDRGKTSPCALVFSTLLIVTSNQIASNKKKNRLNIYPKPGMSHYIPCLIAE